MERVSLDVGKLVDCHKGQCGGVFLLDGASCTSVVLPKKKGKRYAGLYDFVLRIAILWKGSGRGSPSMDVFDAGILDLGMSRDRKLSLGVCGIDDDLDGAYEVADGFLTSRNFLVHQIPR